MILVGGDDFGLRVLRKSSFWFDMQRWKDAFDRYLRGAINVVQPQTGLHTVGWLPDDMNDQFVSTAAAVGGIGARPLSCYSLGMVKSGLVLGFGTVSPKEINEGARKARAFEVVQRKHRNR
jgi:DNA-binding transcriptional MocR family regulator